MIGRGGWELPHPSEKSWDRLGAALDALGSAPERSGVNE